MRPFFGLAPAKAFKKGRIALLVRLLSLALLILLMAPLVAAQGAPAPTVTLTAPETPVIVDREEDRTFTMTVRFDSENPFDGLQPRQIRIEQTVTPAGWSVRVSPNQVTLASGESATVTATVTLGAGAVQSETKVTFTAKLVPRGAEGTPLGAFIDPEAQGTSEVTLKREDPLTREVLEGVGSWIWVVLGAAALVAVILAFVLARGNKPTVVMQTHSPRATVAPGRSVAVPVTVENLLRAEDTILFHVAPVPAGWAASLPVPELPLDGKRREELHLVVTAPKDAPRGTEVSVGLSASSARNPGRIAELVVKVVVGDSEAKKAAGDTTPADKKRA